MDKYGRPNEKTPSSWSNNYVDYNGVKTEGASAPVKVEPISEATTTASTPSNDHEEKAKGKKRKKSEADESSEQKDEKKEKKKKVWRHHPLFPPI